MKVITDTCSTYYISTLIIPDEGFYKHLLFVLYLDIDPTWWRLLQTRVVRTIFRHWSFPDEGYYRHLLYVLYLDFDPTRWRLLQTLVVRTIFRHWSYLMKVITDTCCTYYIYTLILPDEGYYRHVLYVLYLDIDPPWWRLLQTRVVRTISETWILPDEGYYRHVLYVLYLDIDPPWWRLLQTRVVRTIFRHWSYLMKVITDTYSTYYI